MVEHLRDSNVESHQHGQLEGTGRGSGYENPERPVAEGWGRWKAAVAFSVGTRHTAASPTPLARR